MTQKTRWLIPALLLCAAAALPAQTRTFNPRLPLAFHNLSPMALVYLQLKNISSSTKLWDSACFTKAGGAVVTCEEAKTGKDYDDKEYMKVNLLLTKNGQRQARLILFLYTHPGGDFNWLQEIRFTDLQTLQTQEREAYGDQDSAEDVALIFAISYEMFYDRAKLLLP